MERKLMSSMRTALYVGAAALLVAIYPWGEQGYEGYYSFLRFLICGICVFGAYVSLRERSAFAFPFLAVGLLFNPFVPAHANRAFWIVADLVVAAGFLVTARLAPRLDAARVVTFPSLEGNASPEAQAVELSS
jgi:hypothetical protein